MHKLQHFPHTAAIHIDHPAHARQGIHPFPDRLYVVTLFSNPLRWRSRQENYWKFERHVEQSGAVLYTVEVAFGGRKFEVTSPDNPRHLQLRTRDELWHKENALNLLIQRLPADAKYVAWIDCDVSFARPDWAQETLHQLQHYDFVQMFSLAHDLDGDSELTNSMRGFIFRYLTDRDNPNSKKYTNIVTPAQCYGANGSNGFWHPGYAWAARIRSLEKVGGLLDICIMGSADWHMAWALVGNIKLSLNEACTENYKQIVREWAHRCDVHIKRNVGFVTGSLYHWYHGCKTRRNYAGRWQLQVNARYDPLKDLKRDRQGLWQLVKRNTAFRDGIRQYNRARNEDR